MSTTTPATAEPVFLSFGTDTPPPLHWHPERAVMRRKHPVDLDLAVIGWDVDQPLHDFADSFITWLRVINHPAAQVAFDTEGIAEYHGWYEPLGLSADDYWALVQAGVDAGHVLNGRVMPGAAEAVRSVYEAGHLVVLITHRDDLGTNPVASLVTTEAWLRRNHIPYDVLVLSHDKGSVYTDAYFDDRPDNVDRVEECGSVGFLCAAPWQTDADRAGRRVMADSTAYAAAVIGRTPDTIRQVFTNVPF